MKNHFLAGKPRREYTNYAHNFHHVPSSKLQETLPYEPFVIMRSSLFFVVVLSFVMMVAARIGQIDEGMKKVDDVRDNAKDVLTARVEADDKGMKKIENLSDKERELMSCGECFAKCGFFDNDFESNTNTASSLLEIM